MTIDEIDEDEIGLPASAVVADADNALYQRLTGDAVFLNKILWFDPEKIIRFHLMFETEDGEGSAAKREPVLGRVFVEKYGSDEKYMRTCERIRATVESYHA